MQTFLIRRTKGLANDQMRMMCAVIATALLLITYSHQQSPQETAELSLWDKLLATTIDTTEVEVDIAQVANYNSKGITAPGEVGSDVLLEAGVENDMDRVSVREREMFVETTENELFLKRERAREELAARKQIESITCDPTDITKISNMTKEQIGIMVEGTWLEGKEDTLYQIEAEYSINAFFAAVVSTLESEHGSSPRARTRSNYYGMETMVDYVSFENNTEAWADMIIENYAWNENIGPNIHDIGPVYCPPNPAWATIMSGMMEDRYNKVVDHEYKRIEGLTQS